MVLGSKNAQVATLPQPADNLMNGLTGLLVHLNMELGVRVSLSSVALAKEEACKLVLSVSKDENSCRFIFVNRKS